MRPETPNHALPRAAPRVTLAASGLRLSPTTQPACRAPQSLSLGSLGVARFRKPNQTKPHIIQNT